MIFKIERCLSFLAKRLYNLNNTAFEICKTPEQEDISCFQEDRNGKLWLGFDGKGLACYDSKQINYEL